MEGQKKTHLYVRSYCVRTVFTMLGSLCNIDNMKNCVNCALLTYNTGLVKMLHTSSLSYTHLRKQCADISVIFMAFVRRSYPE